MTANRRDGSNRHAHINGAVSQHRDASAAASCRQPIRSILEIRCHRSAIIYLLNRYVSGTLASVLFVALLIAVAALSDRPSEVVDGRGLLVFALPILTASALLRPWASFVAAMAGSAVVVAMGILVVGQPVPNLPAVMVFFLLAVVAWLSARSLERALESLRTSKERLAASEKRYRTLFERLPVGLFRTTPDGEFIEANPAHVELLGCPDRETLLETPVNRFYRQPERREQWKATVEEQGMDQMWEVPWRRLDGTPIWVQEYARAIPDDEGGVACYDGIAVDVTERKRAEERVAHLNRTLRAIRNVDQLITKEKDRDRLMAGACEALTETRGYRSAWAAAFDEEGQVVTTAQAALDEWGPLLDEQLRSDDLTPCVQRALAQSGIVTTRGATAICGDCPLHGAHRDRDAMTARLEHEREVYGLLSVSIPAEQADDEEERALFQEVADDLAFALYNLRQAEEQRRMEEQLRRQERLAAVGQLAAGIAHDFRNLLTTIILYTNLALKYYDLPRQVTKNLETIIGESNKAADLVQQILDFSGRSMLQLQPLDLRSLTQEVIGILRRTIPETVQISLQTKVGETSESFTVEVDPGRMQQMMTNLALNAHDAMPEGGKLRFELSRVVLGEGEMPPTADVEQMDGPAATARSYGGGDGGTSEWIRLSISDTGTGMTEEVQDHLFEPFFTTKDVGEGTGLGLAQVYGIVRQHRGTINVDTELGEGTTFHIYLPAHEEKQEETSEPEASPIPPGRGETLLLVEDEEKLRQAGQAMLESLGYHVLTATNGRQAIEVYAGDEKPDLIITDMVMPEMDGFALMEELTRSEPHLKAVGITGYAVERKARELREAGFLEVVQKPFEVEELARAIRRALD